MVFLFLALGLLIGIGLCQRVVDETPRYLVSKHRYEEAR
jgi:hypothetical protein